MLDNTPRVICEMLVRHLIPRVKIQPEGSVDTYVEKYFPGWLLLQIGRTLWPDEKDVYWYSHLGGPIYRKFTSINIVKMLREEPNYGFMIHQKAFLDWMKIIQYDGENWKAHPKWVPYGTEVRDDNVAHQVFLPGQIQPGMKAKWWCWVPLVDLNAHFNRSGLLFELVEPI